MIKVIYWSNTQQRLIVSHFKSIEDVHMYIDLFYDDIDFKDHFVKIFMEEFNK